VNRTPDQRLQWTGGERGGFHIISTVEGRRWFPLPAAERQSFGPSDKSWTATVSFQSRHWRSGSVWIGLMLVVMSSVGVFYVIQLVPELDSRRLKLGFAESLEQRLVQHRTAAPTAKVLQAWPCKRSWELTAIDALTSVGCRLILNEGFECDDPDALVQRGEAFFRMLPLPTERPPLSESSPLIRQSFDAQRA
jgi:hypothetical protein